MVYSIRDEIEKGFPVDCIKRHIPYGDHGALGELFAHAVDVGREDVATVIAENMMSFSSFVEQQAVKKAAQRNMKEVFEAAFRGKSEGLGIAGYALREAVLDGRRELACMIAKDMQALYWSGDYALEAATHAARMGWTDFFLAGHVGKDGGTQLGINYALEAGKHQQWDTAQAIEMLTGIKAAELKHS